MTGRGKAVKERAHSEVWYSLSWPQALPLPTGICTEAENLPFPGTVARPASVTLSTLQSFCEAKGKFRKDLKYSGSSTRELLWSVTSEGCLLPPGSAPKPFLWFSITTKSKLLGLSTLEIDYRFTERMVSVSCSVVSDPLRPRGL